MKKIYPKKLESSPVLKPPDQEKIREYVNRNKRSLSLVDFADWVVKNIRYDT